MGNLTNKTKIVAGRKIAELLLYGPIGPGGWFGDGDGVSAADFSKAIASARPFDEIEIGINSDGGDVADGIAIYNAMRRIREPVTARVDGMALSAASVVAMGGDRALMAPGSFMMIHDPRTMLFGDAAKLRETAELLDKHGDNLAEIYARRTELPANTIRQIMRAETWYDAGEAVEAGFADEIIEDAPRVAAVFDPKRFANVPARFVSRTPRRDAAMRKIAAMAIDKP